MSGLVILNDPENGLPLAVMDCIWLTAKRTGAASAVAAKYLARPDAEALGIIGCGVQGRSHLEAMRTQFPDLSRVLAYDHAPANLHRYVAEMRSAHRVEVVAAPDAESAVREADIIVTAAGMLRWSRGRSPAGGGPRSGPWPCISASPSRMSSPPSASTGGRWRRASARACRCEGERPPPPALKG